MENRDRFDTIHMYNINGNVKIQTSNVLHMLHLCGKRNENLTLLRNYIAVTCHPVAFLF